MVADIEGLAKVRQLTGAETDALKTGIPERVFPVFMQIMNRKYICHFTFVIDGIEKIIEKDVIVCDVTSVTEYYAEHLACQMLHGDTDVLLGLDGDDEALLSLAGKFAKEEFTEIDEASYDALCELTNCVNGKFASMLDRGGVELDIEPPMCCDGCKIKANAQFYVMKLNVDGRYINVISAIDVIPYLK